MDLKTFAKNVNQMRRFQQLMKFGSTPGLASLKKLYEKLVDDALDKILPSDEQDKQNVLQQE